ncbi:MAG TPA: hypothetical protein VIR98_03210 [Candidatus Paceibacterota bacterium]
MPMKHIIRPVIITALILLIPLFVNHRVEGWNWTGSDFAFAAVILFGFSLAYELIARKGGSMAYKAAVGVAVFAAFILTWGNLAVGFIGEDNPANLFYFAIPLIGLVGASLSRFQPRGMAKTLFVMAAVQMIIPAVAYVVFRPDFAPGVIGVFGLSIAFALLFVGSAVLFQHAARQGALPTERLA